MHCVHLEGGPPEPLRMMVTHSLGTLGSVHPMTQLRVLYAGVLRVLLECCVMHRPAGKCLRRFVGKLLSVWDTHRNIACVVLNMTGIDYMLWDWRISQQCCWTLESSVMWRVIGLCPKGHTFWPCGTAWLWNVWHSVTSQKTQVFSWYQSRQDT